MPSKNGPYLEEDFGASDYGGRQYIIVDVSGNSVLEFKNGKAAQLIERDKNVAVQVAIDLTNDDTAYLAAIAAHYGINPAAQTIGFIDAALAAANLIGSSNPAYNEVLTIIGYLNNAKTILAFVKQ